MLILVIFFSSSYSSRCHSKLIEIKNNFCHAPRQRLPSSSSLYDTLTLLIYQCGLLILFCKTFEGIKDSLNIDFTWKFHGNSTKKSGSNVYLLRDWLFLHSLVLIPFTLMKLIIAWKFFGINATYKNVSV